MTLHWHRDTFDLPAGRGAPRLHRVVRESGVREGTNINGFHFHPEACPKGFENWLVGHTVEMAAAGVDITRLRVDAVRLGAAPERKAHRVAADWLARLES